MKKNLLMILFSLCFLISCIALTYGSRSDAKQVSIPPPPGQKVTLSRSTYYLPGDGVKNNNTQIGPFCCTGETVTVTSTKGENLGYVYFYDWQGQAYNVDDGSIYPNINILVSGASDLAKPDSTQQKGSVYFRPDRVRSGQTIRSTQVGRLCYRAKVTQANFMPYGGQQYFKSGSVAVRVDVSVCPRGSMSAVPAQRPKPVSVQPQSKRCSIAGRATGTRRELSRDYNITLYGPGEKSKFLASTSFDSDYRYKFSGLLEGLYWVVPSTKGDYGQGPTPAHHIVKCKDNVINMDFKF